MKLRTIATLGLTALVFGGTMVGCTHGGGIASASSRSDAAAGKQAAANAAKASQALGAGDAAGAVVLAEAAVAMQPNNAGYRALLGQSYLKAGRFTSAQAAYADLLSLTPENGKAALNLALAQIATGQWAEARRTLAAHAEDIGATDRGLAIALAGDPAAGVELLLAAVRAPDATPKTRQNLALAFALAGRWPEARMVASSDLAPSEADERMAQWAQFAQPAGAADQVAALLGVRPAADPGRPTALALNGTVPVAEAAAAPVVAPVAAQRPAMLASAPVVPETIAALAKVSFAAPREVVQPIPAAVFQAAKVATIRADGAFRRRVEAAAAREQASGDWYVQIGAFSSAGVAKDAWSRAQCRFASFGGKTPQGMTFKAREANYYRLSIGGFARADADATCRAYRAKGGACFVRAGAGDRVAQWLRAETQLAAR